MLTHDTSNRTCIANLFSAITAVGMTTLVACNSQSASNENEHDTIVVSSEVESEAFHADNDIAMTVRSIADAIRVGEPLDSTEYDFEGVLTDGQGAPLYTDVQGAPGIWVVDVLDKKNVTIRNLFLGDLLPNDLEAYLLQSLNLTENHRTQFNLHEAVDDNETDIVVYDFDGGYLRFEIRAGMAPNGLEGPLLTIIMSSDPPAGAEIQTVV